MFKTLWLGVILPLLIYLIPTVGFLFYLHTPEGKDNPFAREILVYFDHSCPFDKTSTKEIDEMKLTTLPESRDLVNAPNKKVWSLYLNQTTEFQLTQWLKRKHINCTKSQITRGVIKCSDVPLRKIGVNQDEGTAQLEFAVHGGTLSFIGILVRGLPTDDTHAVFRAFSKSLEKRYGTPNILDQKSKSISLEYRFNDYVAKLTAAKLARAGLIIYQQHLSANDPEIERKNAPQDRVAQFPF